MTDHYAHSDEHALHLARSIVANFNWKQTSNYNIPEVFHSNTPRPCALIIENAPMPQTGLAYEEPLYPAEEMGSIIPADTKKPFDVRKVRIIK